MRAKSFRLGLYVQTGFKVTLTSSMFGTLESPPRGIAVKCPYYLSRLNSNISFVASTFDLIDGVEYITFDGKNYTTKSGFESAINLYMVGKVNITVSFSFVRSNGAFSGNGFKISYSQSKLFIIII